MDFYVGRGPAGSMQLYSLHHEAQKGDDIITVTSMHVYIYTCIYTYICTYIYIVKNCVYILYIYIYMYTQTVSHYNTTWSLWASVRFMQPQFGFRELIYLGGARHPC